MKTEKINLDYIDIHTNINGIKLEIEKKDWGDLSTMLH